MAQEKDLLWKGVIEDLFADFLRFFYEDADAVFDMKRGFEFLDKELGQLYPGKDIDYPMFVDKLVKVYKKDGGEEWLLIHIEVQGYKDYWFTRRMLTYFLRILDRYDRDISSFAIFIDGDKNYRPDRYEYHSLGTSFSFRFKTYKVLDQDIEALEKNSNPFAMVILTVLISIKHSKESPEELFDLYLGLARRMLKKGFSRETVRNLFKF